MKLRVLFVLAAGLFVCQVLMYADYLIDDTFISVRYAQNWVDGHGLVFNPGERVEGYTNFSFVVLAAFFLKLGLDPIWWIKGLALAASLGMLVTLAGLERRIVPGTTLPGSVLLLLPLPGFAYWSCSGMETMFFTALLTVAISVGSKESERQAGDLSAGIFVLLALTRPEGVYCFAVWSAVTFFLDLRRGRFWSLLRRHLVNALSFTLMYGAYYLWRYWYYGYPFPNTYYAKVTGGVEQWLTGLEYLHKWALALPVFTAMLLAPLTVLYLRPSRPIAAIYVFVLAYVAYVISVGGDFMAHFRFFLPVMPLCGLLLCWALHPSRLRGPLLVAACVLQVCASLASTQREVAFVAHRYTIVGKHVGRWLAEVAEPQDLIAVNTAGAVPFYSRLPAIDMLGLTDEKIAHRPIYIVTTGWSAHRRGWGEYVMNRRPRFIYWYNMAGSRDPFYLTDRELADDPYFRFFYQLKSKKLAGDADPNQPQMVARFLDFPFGTGPDGEDAPATDMGLVVRFQRQPFALTTFYEGPILMSYFERDERDAALWELREVHRQAPEAFVDAVVERWSTETEPGFDPLARAKVEAMCQEAQKLVESGQMGEASRLLTSAEALNGAARSSMVYQYLANLAVLAKDPYMAVRAQKEALRLEPRNGLFRSNFKALLRLPYADSKKGQDESPGKAGADTKLPLAVEEGE